MCRGSESYISPVQNGLKEQAHQSLPSTLQNEGFQNTPEKTLALHHFSTTESIQQYTDQCTKSKHTFSEIPETSNLNPCLLNIRNSLLEKGGCQ